MKGAVLAELTVIARASSPTVKEGFDSLPNNRRALLDSRATAPVGLEHPCEEFDPHDLQLTAFRHNRITFDLIVRFVLS